MKIHFFAYIFLVLPCLLQAQFVEKSFAERRKLLKQKYDIVEQAYPNGLIIAQNDPKKGYVSSDGTAITDFIYDGALPFFNRFAAVKRQGKWGFINTKGKEVIACEYDGFQEANILSGKVWVEKAGIWGLIDTTEKVLFPFEVDEIGAEKSKYWFHSERNSYLLNHYTMPVKKGEKWGVINDNGELILPYIYTSIDIISPFIYAKNGIETYIFDANFQLKHKGLVKTFIETLWLNKQYFFVEKEDNKITVYDEMQKVRWGGADYEKINIYESDSTFFFQVQKKEENYGLLDTNFQEIMPPIYENIHIEEGFIVAAQKTGTGFFTLTGKSILPCLYDEIDKENGFFMFDNRNWVSLRQNEKYGVFDLKNERFVVPWQAKYRIQSYDSDKKEFFVTVFDSAAITLDTTAIPYSTDNKGIIKTYCKKPLSNINRPELWGIMDSTLNILLPTKYDYLATYAGGAIYLVSNKEGGFILDSNKNIIYTFDKSISDMRFEKAGKMGIINMYEATFIPAKYQEINHLTHTGLFKATYDSLHYGIVKGQGEEVYPFIFDEIEIFYTSDNERFEYIHAYTKDKIYVLTDSAKLLHIFDKEDANNRYAIWQNEAVKWEKKGGKWGGKNAKGQIIMPFVFDELKYILPSNTNPFEAGKLGRFDAIILNHKLPQNSQTYSSFDIYLPDSVPTLKKPLPVAKQISVKENKMAFHCLNKQNKNILPPNTMECKVLADNLIAYKINDLWGFVDTTGKILHTAQFESIVKNKPFISIRKNKKAGYIDLNGNIVVSPQYDYFGTYFVGNDFKLAVSGDFGQTLRTDFRYLAEDLPNNDFMTEYEVWADNKGKERILVRRIDKVFVMLNLATLDEYPLATELTYYDFSNYSIIYQKGKEVIFMDLEGKIIQKILGDIVPERVDKNYFLHKNCFMVKIKATNKTVYHVYNTNGERLLNTDLDSAYFYNDYIVAKKENQMGLFNLEGIQVLPFEYEEVIFTNEKQVFKVKKAGKYGLVNEKNEIIIPFEYTQIANDFAKNSLVAAKNNFCGVITIDNEVIVPFQYKGLKILNDSFFAFQNDCEFGLIEKSGRFSLPDTFSNIENIIDNRYMMASRKGQMGIVTIATGEIIVPFSREYTQFNAPRSFSDNLSIYIFNDYPGIHGINTRRYVVYNNQKHNWVSKNIYQDLDYDIVGGYYKLNRGKSYIDSSGTIVSNIPQKVIAKTHLAKRLYKIVENEYKEYALFDSLNQVVLPWDSAKMSYFSYEDAAKNKQYYVLRNKHLWCVNTGENKSLNIEFQDIMPIRNTNLSWAKTKGKWGIMDIFEAENWLIQPRYEYVREINYEKQLFICTKNSDKFIIDIQNQIISDELQPYR